MLNFTRNLKMYLFKDRHTVTLSIKVSDCFAQSYDFPVAQFEEILAMWREPNGADLRVNNQHWHFCHKHRTPRPESTPASYVRISVHANNVSSHYRVDFQDMVELGQEYFFQKHNRMHWDPA
jgi:hypothetical protein